MVGDTSLPVETRPAFMVKLMNDAEELIKLGNNQTKLETDEMISGKEDSEVEKDETGVSEQCW